MYQARYPEGGPTVVDVAPVPACQSKMMMMMMMMMMVMIVSIDSGSIEEFYESRS